MEQVNEFHCLAYKISNLKVRIIKILDSKYNLKLACILTCGRGVKLITHLLLIQRLRMLGYIPPLLQYVFMAWYLIKHTSI